MLLQGKVVTGRMLVCADGSTSRLATQLGYCTAPPQVGGLEHVGPAIAGRLVGVCVEGQLPSAAGWLAPLLGSGVPERVCGMVQHGAATWLSSCSPLRAWCALRIAASSPRVCTLHAHCCRACPLAPTSRAALTTPTSMAWSSTPAGPCRGERAAWLPAMGLTLCMWGRHYACGADKQAWLAHLLLRTSSAVVLAQLARPLPLPARSYAAIFKHAKDELGFCYYLIPCGNKAQTGQCGNCTVRRWAGLGGGRWA